MISSSLLGGGGGVPIGAMVALPTNGEDLFEFRGQSYLRSGSLAPAASFPDAPTVATSAAIANKIAAPDAATVMDMTFDGTHFYVIWGGGQVRQYDASWAFTGLTSTGLSATRDGIAFIGNGELVVTGGSSAVNILDTATLTVQRTPNTGLTSHEAICYDGLRVWGKDTGNKLHSFVPDVVGTAVTYDAILNWFAGEVIGDYLYLLFNSTASIEVFNLAGSHTGLIFPLPDSNTATRGMVLANGVLNAAERTTNEFLQWTPTYSAGQPMQQFDAVRISDSETAVVATGAGAPLCMRVK